MKIVELIRLETSKDYGTLGVLKINKKVFCCTLEPSDEENKSNISSIPTGQYTCDRYNSKTYGETFKVTNVTDRSYILFHKGNVKGNTKGCILLGKYFGKLSSAERAVLNSGYTFDKFMKIFDDDFCFHLTISESY